MPVNNVKGFENCQYHHMDLLNLYECEIGEGTKLGSFIEIGRGVKIGKRCKIQSFAFIPEGVLIGDDVFIGPHVCFTNTKHPMRNEPYTRTIIGNNVSIGAGSTVLPGISIEDNALIGAGTTVHRKVKKNTCVLGSPMRVVYLYVCEVCGATFTSKDHRKPRFCSRQCYNKAIGDEKLKVELGMVSRDYKITAKYKEYINNCTKREVGFKLSFEEFKSLWKRNCFYCGTEIETIGIDRIDNSSGYSVENIVACCWECNRMKSKLEQQEFIEHVERIYENLH